MPSLLFAALFAQPRGPNALLCAWTHRSPRPLSIDVPHLGVFRAPSHRAHRPNSTQKRVFHPLAALQRQIWGHRRVPRVELVPERPSYDQTIAWFDQTIVWFDTWCAPAPPPSTEHISEINHSMVWTCPGPPIPTATPLDTPLALVSHHASMCALGYTLLSAIVPLWVGCLPPYRSLPYSSYTGSRHWKCHLRHGGLLRRHLDFFARVHLWRKWLSPCLEPANACAGSSRT